MRSEDNELSIDLDELNPDVLRKIMSYGKGDTAGQADALREYLKAEGSFEDMMTCPECRTIPLKGLPILEAEKDGFIELKGSCSRGWARKMKMYFAICPECLWWGIPDSTARRLWQKQAE